MENLILIGAWIIGGIILLTVLGAVFSSLYKRASKEVAFVRTGLGGEHVVINGGALILPVVHGTIDVNMNTIRLEVRRSNENALITRDRMRVDVAAEFYVRVQPSRESIAAAAQTLGGKTMEPISLKELVEGKFVDALRAVAAEMAMEELHEQRVNFVQKVQQAVSEDLLKNGLELESVSLTGLDQTNREYFNPENVFDAEGLTMMTRQIEERRKIRNDIEQDTQVQIAQKNLAAQTTKYEIERQQEAVRLDNEKQIEKARAEQGYEIGKAREEARRQTRAAEIIADQAIEISIQEGAIAVAKKSEETSLANAKASEARAQQVSAEERVATARATEIAEREKNIELIEAEKQAQQQAISITVAAKAELDAAQNRAEAIKVVAMGEADAEKIRAEAAARTYEVEAEGQSRLNAAANTLSTEQRDMQVRLHLIDQMPKIIEQSVKPLEKIDGIKIVQMQGSPLSGGKSDGAAAAAGGFGAESIANAALQYRSHAPLIDALLGEVGMKGGSLEGLTAAIEPLKDNTVSVDAAPVAESDVVPGGDPAEVQADAVPLKPKRASAKKID